MRIIGLDIAMCNVGVVSVHYELGVLTLTSCATIVTKRPKKKLRISETIDNMRRVQHIASELAETIQEVEPDLFVVESQSWPRINPSSSIQMAQSWGAIFPLLVGVPVMEVSPQALKVAVWGSREASKAEVHLGCLKLMQEPLQTQSTVDRCVPSKELQEHCWDALGAVLAVSRLPEFQELALRHR